MAVKQYGYYIKGNKVAIVEKDTQFDNDTSSRDFGPGSERAQWKSPKSDVTDGLEIEYVYSPEYTINDLSETCSVTSYDEEDGTGLLKLVGTSFPTTGITHIVVTGSDKWNGLHKINTLSSSSAMVLETKYNGASVTESFTFYKDVDTLNDESDEVRVSSYLSKAIVYYVKARVAEDTMNIEAKEYFMKEFRKMLEKHNNTRVGGLRITAVGSHGII